MMVAEFHFKSEHTAGHNEWTTNINWILTVIPKANVQQGWNFFIPQRMQILCKVQMHKWMNSRTEKVKFQPWKHKKPTWTSIEERAEVLGKIALFLKVKGVDLFVKEVHYREICRNSFNTDCANHTTWKAPKKDRYISSDEISSPRCNICRGTATPRFICNGR